MHSPLMSILSDKHCKITRQHGFTTSNCAIVAVEDVKSELRSFNIGWHPISSFGPPMYLSGLFPNLESLKFQTYTCASCILRAERGSSSG